MLSQIVRRCEYNVILNSNFTNCVKVLSDTFQFGRRTDWATNETHVTWSEYSETNESWQKPETGTTWTQQPIMMHFILPPPSLSSPFSIFLCSLCPTWGDNNKEDRSGHLTLETEAWPGASPHPRPWEASANQRPG